MPRDGRQRSGAAVRSPMTGGELVPPLGRTDVRRGALPAGRPSVGRVPRRRRRRHLGRASTTRASGRASRTTPAPPTRRRRRTRRAPPASSRPYTADRLGPILDYGEFVGGNVAGCIEVTTPERPHRARKSVQALTDCELAACQANCPVSDSTSLTAREQCAAARRRERVPVVLSRRRGCRRPRPTPASPSRLLERRVQGLLRRRGARSSAAQLPGAGAGAAPRRGYRGDAGLDATAATPRRRERPPRTPHPDRPAMALEAPRDDDPDIGLLRVLRDDGSADPATDPAAARGDRSARLPRDEAPAPARRADDPPPAPGPRRLLRRGARAGGGADRDGPRGRDGRLGVPGAPRAERHARARLPAARLRRAGLRQLGRRAQGPADAEPPVGSRGEPGELVVVHRPADPAGRRRRVGDARAQEDRAVAVGFWATARRASPTSTPR